MSGAIHDTPRSTFERVLARRTDDLVRSQAERAAELAQQGGAHRNRPRRLTLARIAGFTLALLFVRLAFCGTPGRRGNEPIGAAAVATADGAGVGSSVSAFLPLAEVKAVGEPASAPAATPATAEPKTPPRTTPRPATRPARPHVEHDATSIALQTGDAPPVIVSTVDAQADFTSEVGLAGATSSRSNNTAVPSAVINVGTRLNATLEAPVRTGSALAPATAVLAEDVRTGERVLLKAGTRLVGSAFATPHDDRVQITWRALVHDGRTLEIRADTIGQDGAPGLPGKLIRRHRRSVFRRIGSTLAATAGEAAGYAVPLGDTALEQAGAVLAGRAGRELGQLDTGREFLQADTVIELKAGTPVVIYVSADIKLGEAGAK